jgi:hypothetical protein
VFFWLKQQSVAHGWEETEFTAPIAEGYLFRGTGRTLARRGLAAYARHAVKKPFVNVEEKIDRFVGRRTGTPDSLRAGMQLQATAAQLHKSFGHRWWPKGVYRFKTHEEADAWMTKMLAQSGLPKT